MTRDIGVYVADILEQMEALEQFVAGCTLADVIDDKMRSYAIVRAFEIMGEAAKHVPEPVRARCPEVPWREMAGMRDRLAHAYWGIDLAFAWQAIHERFPVERPALRRLLAALDADA